MLIDKLVLARFAVNCDPALAFAAPWVRVRVHTVVCACYISVDRIASCASCGTRMNDVSLILSLQALKALEAARKALETCSDDLAVLDGKRDQVTRPIHIRAERHRLCPNQGHGVARRGTNAPRRGFKPVLILARAIKTLFNT